MALELSGMSGFMLIIDECTAPNMNPISFLDIRYFRRCPFVYSSRKRTEKWTITLSECLEMSIRDAVTESECRHSLGDKPDKDRTLSAFWDAWDRHIPDVYPENIGSIHTIKFGEKCLSNYVLISKRVDPSEIVSSPVTGLLRTAGGSEVLVSIDEIRRANATVTIVIYVADSEIGTPDRMIRDPCAKASAVWVHDNLPNCRQLKIRWEFLSSGTYVEYHVLNSDLEQWRVEISEMAEIMNGDPANLNESDYCRECPHLSTCPRFLHELSLSEDPDKMGADQGVKLVDEYTELQEKISALKSRIESLELRQKAIAELLIGYSDSKGYMAVSGTDSKVLIKHETKVELPEDKTAIIERLKEIGQYDSLSMVNYSRLRSDISKHKADPEIERMADISSVRRVYLRAGHRVTGGKQF